MEALATKDGRANLIRAFKASGCVKCGVRYPDVDWSELHLDHLDPSEKQKGWSAGLISRAAVAEILAELLKCQVLCTKHHKEKHGNGAVTIEGQLAMFSGNGSWFYSEIAK